jgi:hypothetical protein
MSDQPALKTVTLTEAQARNVLAALDIAVRAEGMRIAAPALAIAQTIEAQLSTRLDPDPAG